jgi:uncharacterized protein (DUF362 family)
MRDLAMKVAAVKTASYAQEEVAEGISEALGLLGGPEQFVAPGDRVLLKVNMLEALPPDRVVTTHPYVVHEVLFSKEAVASSSEQSGVFQ